MLLLYDRRQVFRICWVFRKHKPNLYHGILLLIPQTICKYIFNGLKTYLTKYMWPFSTDRTCIYTFLWKTLDLFTLKYNNSFRDDFCTIDDSTSEIHTTTISLSRRPSSTNKYVRSYALYPMCVCVWATNPNPVIEYFAHIQFTMRCGKAPAIILNVAHCCTHVHTNR